MRQTRRWAAAGALLLIALLPACKREPTFDERYAGAQQAIRQKAGDLDRDMTKRADEASALPSEAATSSEAP